MSSNKPKSFPSLDVVVGGQFGSEAKGRVTLERVRHRLAQGKHVGSMRVAGPNAGHVVIDPKGERFAMRSLPVGFIEPKVGLYIAAGSEVDPQVLRAEIELVESKGYRVRDRLFIHPEATYLTPDHIRQERDSDLTRRLGSTAKGIGAARADRIWRRAQRVADIPEPFYDLGQVVDFNDELREFMSNGLNVAIVIEGTQGYGLGAHAGFYPQCTSSDARAIDFLAMAGINPWDLSLNSDFRIHVVIRPYPIRVAGNSGPLKGETNWSELGLPEEHTTVTQKVRRVGEFDPGIVQEAIAANGVALVQLHLSMADQVAPSLAGLSEFPDGFADTDDAVALDNWVAKIPHPERIATLGTGPATSIDLAAIADQIYTSMIGMSAESMDIFLEAIGIDTGSNPDEDVRP